MNGLCFNSGLLLFGLFNFWEIVHTIFPFVIIRAANYLMTFKCVDSVGPIPRQPNHPVGCNFNQDPLFVLLGRCLNGARRDIVTNLLYCNFSGSRFILVISAISDLDSCFQFMFSKKNITSNGMMSISSTVNLQCVGWFFSSVFIVRFLFRKLFRLRPETPGLLKLDHGIRHLRWFTRGTLGPQLQYRQMEDSNLAMGS